MKVGDRVVVYDDGKKSRPAEGRVVWTSGEASYSILVSFFPWGYGSDGESTLVVFKRIGNSGNYEGLNPMLELSRGHDKGDRAWYDSEYCLIKGEEK